MKHLSKYHFRLGWIAALLISLGMPGHMVGAQTRSGAGSTSRIAQLAAGQSHVTIIVLDMSGSMAQNDPDGLRCSAGNAYIDLSGPGSSIGVVGLDSNGNTGGPHNFQEAIIWAQPTDMSTLSARQGLQQTIAQKSNNCRPHNSTPTYDALNQALTMLENATNGGKTSGSVILLTDGIPDPDTNAQIDAINAELLPQFQQHGWPIDTVALGQDGPIPGMNGTFHSFLSGIANTTSGKFYDDGNGVVSGVSPLNIAPFFVDIFALRNGRTVGPTIEPTSLDGGTTSRDFQLGNYVDHLDVIVVKDQASTQITLTSPTGQTLPPQVAGTFVSTRDPHYAIFSVDGPQPGTWTVNVRGSGQFLMDSLVESSLKVSITAPSASPALPLGQAFTIAAAINYQGQSVSGGQFSVTGSVAYSGAPTAGTGPYMQQIVLSDASSPGTYTAQVTVPENAASGSYAITVSASQVSSVAISSAHRTIRLERFPEPLFLSPQSNQATAGAVSTTVTQWDWALQHVYGAPVGFLQWLGQHPLGSLPAHPEAIVKGEVQLQGIPYPGAAVTATASRMGKHDNLPVTVFEDGSGLFHIQFEPPAGGTYVVTFQTRGSFQDTHGDFGTTTRTVVVTIQQASIGQELVAWLWTAIYLLVLYLLWRIIRFFATPSLFGEWVRSEDGEVLARHYFNQSRRNPFGAFFHRNILRSTNAGLPPGLRFRFNRGDSIEVRADGHDSAYWKSDGDQPRNQYSECRELVFSPDGHGSAQDGEEDDVSGAGTYLILPRRQQRSARGSDDDGDSSDYDRV